LATDFSRQLYFPALVFEPIQIPNEIAGNGALTGLRCGRSLCSFEPDLREFAGIEPIASATGTLIDFNAAFGTEEVTVEFYACAPRAIALARIVNDYGFIPPNMHQVFPGGFLLLIDPLQLKGIEPYAATAILADINLQAANLNLREFVETRRAFHNTVAWLQRYIVTTLHGYIVTWL
jgi:hypothetical protein